MMAKKEVVKKKSRVWIFVVIVLVVLSFIGYVTPKEEKKGNVALIQISGEISTEGTGSLFSHSPSSMDVVNQLKKAEENEDIKAIILAINSPGGSPVGGEEIVSQVKSSNKLVVSYIRDVGASAGYWVASASDKIYASPLSIVGSVGVRSDFLEISGLLKRYNVTYVPLHAGEYKDSGNLFREATDDEIARLREKTSIMHEYFVDDVASNRKLEQWQIEEIKKADFYVGLQAKNLSLIDDFGGQQEAVEYIKSALSIEPKVVEYAKTLSFFELFSGMMSEQSYSIGKGIGSSLKDELFFMK